MKSFRLIVSFAVLLLLLVVVGVRPLTTEVDDVDDNERTCSLDPSTSSSSDCSTTTASDGDAANIVSYNSHRNGHIDITHRREVISLTDDNFDTLTQSSTPVTWLIMFKTNSCGICKKAFPILEALSKDADVVQHNCNNFVDYVEDDGGLCNNDEIPSVDEAARSMQPREPTTASDGNDDEVPKGPIYIATIDAGWSGRDTTRRFEVDATPTIIVVRNEGHMASPDNEEHIDARSYYVYRGQRATYPLRSFILGGYTMRKRMDMPPPLSDKERKPVSALGRMYEYIISPSAKWAGGILVKIVLAWFVFIGVLGLFLRIHNYAWGGDDDGQKDDVSEIEKEKARGREEYNAMTADEKIERRQQMMWERKEKNRAMFAAKREAREKAKRKEDGDDEQLEGVGVAVKKSDAKKLLRENKKDFASKSKDN
jgi:hypothetical protein